MSRLVRPPAAHSFPPCRKRMERKGALGYVWCVLRVWLSQVLILQSLRTHKLTLRVLNYAPPVTGQQICGQLRFNICGKNALRSKFTKQYEFAENSHKIVPLQGLQQYVRKEREPMDLFSPVTDLRGVGPARAAALQRLGIYTLYDLLAYFPRDYEDRTNPVEIAQLQPGVLSNAAERPSARSASASASKR